MQRIKRLLLLAVALGLSSLLPATLFGQTTTRTGALADGATFVMEVPANWNGVLLLYSHGYVRPGSPNPAVDAGDPFTHGFLLAHGFALAGSSYASTGWAVQEGLLDQLAVLDQFDAAFGQPARTIAWGHSLGGMITAGLVQRDHERFSGALPMCGVLSGAVGTWNVGLDSAFAFKTLLASSTGLQVVGITAPAANLGIAEGALAAAQASPQGRARIALSAALSDIPGWFSATSPEPGPTDFDAQEANQFSWLSQVGFPFVFAFRADIEARAGGNPSWNTGVDYEEQLERSANAAEVKGLYAEAGLDLDADLDTLNQAARIQADESAVDFLETNIIFNGDLDIPVLTMHTTDDGLVGVQNERAFSRVVRRNGEGNLLRQTFVHRPGHCAFTPAETITALQQLMSRLDTGDWGDLTAQNLNTGAAALGPLNVAPPSFVDFRPTRFLRPFDQGRREFRDER